MAEEKKTDSKPKKPKKKNSKVDTPSIIFFAVMIIGLIVLTIIVFTRPSSKIYVTNYGSDFTVAVEMFSNNKIDLAVEIGQDRVIQSGTYEEIKDDDIENNYTAEFTAVDDKEKSEKVTILIVDDQLTMTYEDGEEIILKESK